MATYHTAGCRPQDCLPRSNNMVRDAIEARNIPVAPSSANYKMTLPAISGVLGVRAGWGDLTKAHGAGYETVDHHYQ
jgi:hypothetical protein